MAPDYDDILGTDRGERLAKFLGDVKGPWTKEKIITYLRADGRCEYCGADLLSSCEAFWGSDWDHIVPKKHGGEEHDFGANIALACCRCNTLKGRDLPGGGKADELLKMRRQYRINVFKPLVLEQRRKTSLLACSVRSANQWRRPGVPRHEVDIGNGVARRWSCATSDDVPRVAALLPRCLVA